MSQFKSLKPGNMLWFFSLFLVLFLITMMHRLNQSKIVKPTEYVNKTLYLDRRFTDTEVELITEAAIEWNVKTKNRVSFEVKKLPQDSMEVEDSIVFNKVNVDCVTIIILDAMNGNGTIGYYDDRDVLKAILIVSDRLDDKNEYRAVVMHELGHALDLQHMNGADGVGALMSPSMSTGSLHITDKDVDQYCKIHHCKDF